MTHPLVTPIGTDGDMYYDFDIMRVHLGFHHPVDQPDTIILDTFLKNSGSSPGAGKLALRNALIWFLDKHPEVTRIELVSVPDSTLWKKVLKITRDEAQKKLDRYYLSLGFKVVPSKERNTEFDANIKDIIATINRATDADPKAGDQKGGKWNQFRTLYKGSGLNITQLSELYQKQRLPRT